MLEIVYRVAYDYMTSSYGADSRRTEYVKSGSIAWDGAADIDGLVRTIEADFLTAEHPSCDPHSWAHENFRVEVVGLRIGGEHGLVFSPAAPLIVRQATQTEAA